MLPQMGKSEKKALVSATHSTAQRREHRSELGTAKPGPDRASTAAPVAPAAAVVVVKSIVYQTFW